ncbi:hypothetical protein E2C01_069389 [Portunus trituberculatus]|uniref:Uncharacterized protein n=1 Tax=Portunus trituberculatus TaxID=210409 RepID=A0A5B7HZ86_PORTR|nr:hypothetical protein [Portunus trituberculatus]
MSIYKYLPSATIAITSAHPWHHYHHHSHDIPTNTTVPPLNITITTTITIFHRTKWKRQNQMRLEQLRQSVGVGVEKELLAGGVGGERSSPGDSLSVVAPSCCPPYFLPPTVDRSCFITTAGLFTRLPYSPSCSL